MTITFPTTLDTLTNPAATDKEDNSAVYHDVQHSDANDAIEALETKVGVDNSSVASTLDYRVRNLEGYAWTPSGSDDNFDDGSFSGWTAVNSGSHNPTITEARGRLSVSMPGSDAAGELHAYMKAITPATNDWIEWCISGFGRSQNYNICGLIWANGTTYGAGSQSYWYLSPNENNFSTSAHTNYSTGGSISGIGFQTQAPVGRIYARYRYEGSNTFRGYVSPDGISWIDFTGAVSRTLTPTHVGFAFTSWGGTNPFVWCIDYVRFGNG